MDTNKDKKANKDKNINKPLFHTQFIGFWYCGGCGKRYTSLETYCLYCSRHPVHREPNIPSLENYSKTINKMKKEREKKDEK